MVTPIVHAAELSALVERLRHASRVALDTEAASFHRYFDRIYLVQISSDEETALIDPLSVADLTPIGLLLADPTVEVVFHDADYDLRILDRDYGYRATRIFDTRIAAQLAGEPAVGLGALLEKHFGVTTDKRLQRADWSVRPLPSDMLAYAAADTMHLLRLRDALEQALRAAGRLSWAQEEFARLEGVRWTAPADEAAFLRLKGAKGLSRRAQSVLQALHSWREDRARTLDRPPFRVMPNEALVAVARITPRTRGGVLAVPGLPPALARRHADELLQAVERGLAAPLEGLPRPGRSERLRPDAATERRFERLKALRNRRAAELGLPPGVVCPNAALAAIARAAPTSSADLDGLEELRRWQINALGLQEILRVSGPHDPVVQ